MDKDQIKLQIEKLKKQLATEKERHKSADERHKSFIAGLSKQAANPSNVKSGSSKSIRNQIARSKEDYSRDKDSRKRGYERIISDINRLKEKLK
jgi:multidrug resistance efflux pump